LIPGKIHNDDKNTFFAHGGHELNTHDSVHIRSQVLSMTPDDKPQGYEGDTKYWSALCFRNEHETVPGKATADGKCWYPYCGQNECNDFLYILGEPEKTFKEAVGPQGWQYGADATWCILANSKFGLIPGK
jgi:hypothetical protein